MSADPATPPTLVPLAEMPILLLTGDVNLVRHDGSAYGEKMQDIARDSASPLHASKLKPDARMFFDCLDISEQKAVCSFGSLDGGS